jgi:hypothetical protein
MEKTKFAFDGSISATIRDSSYAKFFVALSDGDLLINIVKSFITVGLSPVYSIGRFQRYSQSYKDWIQGKIRFITVAGRVIPILPPSNGKRKGKFPPPVDGKKVSPVSMTLKGDMLNSMYLEKKGSKIILGISDYKAQYHNDMGAGKSKVIRRLLPTKSGEKFITNIDSRLKRLGKLAVQNALNEKKSLLIVNYVFKGK